MSEHPTPNVIIFGGPGVGKSSIVNMILGHDKAEVNNGATRRMFESAPYLSEIKGATFNLHDTTAFGEGKISTADGDKAATNLGQLVKKLSDTGGVNLLVFVVKCGRLTKTTQKNYKMFKKYVCDSRVPIVIAVTGCENVEPMDNWWTDNEKLFSKASMDFRGHACVCAYRGRKTKEGDHVNDEQFDKSKKIVEDLICDNYLKTGWTKPAWSEQVVRRCTEKLKGGSKIQVWLRKLYFMLGRGSPFAAVFKRSGSAGEKRPIQS